MASDLESTSERVDETTYKASPGGYLIYLMHMAAYQWAEPFCRNKAVVELGCGTGYGAHHLARVARSVYAVDVSPQAIAYAQDRYQNPNLVFDLVREGDRLPFPDHSFDVALSFQVIEHIADDSAYLAEAKRLLRPGGTLIVVTPNRQPRLLPGQRPWNRWHIREYSMRGLLAQVGKFFHVTAHLYMGLRPEVAELELRRYRLLKWLSLPFTFPGAPERWRQFGLVMMHRFRPKSRSANAPYEPTFGPEMIEIGNQVAHPVNLIVVATTAKGSNGDDHS